MSTNSPQASHPRQALHGFMEFARSRGTKGRESTVRTISVALRDRRLALWCARAGAEPAVQAAPPVAWPSFTIQPYGSCSAGMSVSASCGTDRALGLRRAQVRSAYLPRDGLSRHPNDSCSASAAVTTPGAATRAHGGSVSGHDSSSSRARRRASRGAAFRVGRSCRVAVMRDVTTQHAGDVTP